MTKQKLVLKQGSYGTFGSTDGWSLVPVGPSNAREWTLYDPSGKMMSSSINLRGQFVEGYEIEYFTYFQRYGRHLHSKFPMQLRPWHLPPGTVVEVDSMVAKGKHEFDENKQTRFTVDYAVAPDAGYCLVVMRELFEHGMFGNKQVSYDSQHIIKIVSRPEESTFEPIFHQLRVIDKPKMNNSGPGNGVFFIKTPTDLFDGLDVEANNRGLGDCSEILAAKHLIAMGLMWYSGHLGFLVKFKKARKWLRKNLHRICVPVRYSYGISD